MAWTTTTLFHQNGNTIRSWDVGDKTGMTNRDCVVVNAEPGVTSSIILHNVRVRTSPRRYQMRVEVQGGGAAAFRFSAEAMSQAGPT